MKDKPDFLHVHGPDIVNGCGEVMRLRVMFNWLDILQEKEDH